MEKIFRVLLGIVIMGMVLGQDVMSMINTAAHDQQGELQLLNNPQEQLQSYECYLRFRSHSANVTALALSPDGQYLASAAIDRHIKIWDTKTIGDDAQPIRLLKGHSASVHALCFSPDGRYLASGSDDKTVCIWDVEKLYQQEDSLLVAILRACTPTASVDQEKYSKFFDFSDCEGDEFFKALQSAVIQRQFAFAKEFCFKVRALSFSSDSRYLAAGYLWGPLVVWNAAQFNEFQSPLFGMTWAKNPFFSPVESQLFFIGEEALCKCDLADNAAREPKTLIKLSGNIEQVHISPSGLLLAVIFDGGRLAFVDISDSMDNPRLTVVPDLIIKEVLFLPGSEAVAVILEDKTINIWRLNGLCSDCVWLTLAEVNECLDSPSDCPHSLSSPDNSDNSRSLTSASFSDEELLDESDPFDGGSSEEEPCKHYFATLRGFKNIPMWLCCDNRTGNLFCADGEDILVCVPCWVELADNDERRETGEIAELVEKLQV